MTLFGFFTSALMPIFMSFGGVGFGDNIDIAPVSYTHLFTILLIYVLTVKW